MKKSISKKWILIITILVLFILIAQSCISVQIVVTPNEETPVKKGVLYQGVAPGYNDFIYVDVYLDGLTILDVTVTKHNETPGIGGELKDKNGKVLSFGGESPITLIPKMMVKNQSINIDTVTGATVTCYGIEHAVVDALKNADIRVDVMTSPTEVLDEEEIKRIESIDYELSNEEKELYSHYYDKAIFATPSYIKETDVIVVGGGGAGLSAALRVLENNKKVVLIEKNGEVGGDTLVCGAIYNAPDKVYQKKLTMDQNKIDTIKNAIINPPKERLEKELQNEIYEELELFINNNEKGVFDSPSWYAYQTWIGGNKVANLSLVKVLADNSYKMLTKLKSYGMEFYDYVSEGAGSLWERTHTSKMQMGSGLISTLLSGIEKYNKNINIYTQVEAKELIYEINENGECEVKGVKCIDKYGKEFIINSKCGVILATGGFSANKEMINEYNVRWDKLDQVETTNRFSCSQGDGINLAKAVNADFVDLNEIQLLYLGNTVNGELTRYPKRNVNGTDQIMFINEYGRRFTNECGRRDDISKSILRLDRNYFYILESGDGKDYVDVYSEDFSSADGFSLKYLVDNGYIIVADTLEELALKLNMKYDTLKSTIDDFNNVVDGKKQDQFGRTLFSTKFTKGPYVATPRQVSIHHTMGGIKINENAQVIDKNGNVIKGLFAAGEVTGGIHGANRLGGNAVVDICVFGNIAGENVIK